LIKLKVVNSRKIFSPFCPDCLRTTLAPAVRTNGLTSIRM
jgi:hypothetical protein